uniref:Candidate secreted effector n=1 Tax=Meloidogyne incognita TaxID=6306 RepID=A0A914N502_MELIC
MLFGLLYKTFFGSKSKNGDSSSENLIENNVNESVGNVDENSVDMVSDSGSHSYNESVGIIDENSGDMVSVSSSHSSSSSSRSKSRSPSRSPSRSSRSRSSSSDSSMDKNINDKPSNPIISEPSSSNSLQKYGKASYPMKRVRFANQRYSPYNRSVRVHKSGNIINKVPTVRIVRFVLYF